MWPFIVFAWPTSIVLTWILRGFRERDRKVTHEIGPSLYQVTAWRADRLTGNAPNRWR